MNTVAKNQPCPCGSGKKYKRCCEKPPIPETVRKVNLDFDAIVFFKAYNFSELLNWLQVIICYPSNQRFINRIEFLIGQLLTIPSNEFKGDPVTRQDIVRLFDGTKKSYDALFFTFEDFTAFPQENLIPLFFEGERFYFFYAGLERPYEYYTELIDRYFISPLRIFQVCRRSNHCWIPVSVSRHSYY
jgi:hypothetical protein